MEFNLTSCMALSRALVLGIKERRWGRVIHISRIMGLVSTVGRNACLAPQKVALLGLAWASALDVHGPVHASGNRATSFFSPGSLWSPFRQLRIMSPMKFDTRGKYAFHNPRKSVREASKKSSLT